MSIRSAASWAQPLQLRSGPRGALTGRGPDFAGRVSLVMAQVCAGSRASSFGTNGGLRQVLNQLSAEIARAEVVHRKHVLGVDLE